MSTVNSSSQLDSSTISHAETTPLLQTEAGAPEAPRPSSESTHPQASYILLFVCAVMVLIDFGGYLNIAPQNQIFETIICDDYYDHDAREGLVSELDCKIKPVQQELALVNGWKDMFDQIPSIILGLPYGILADRIGRKPVLILVLLGGNLTECCVKLITWFPSVFPLRLVWATSLFQVIGGGSQVGTSMFFVFVTDIYSPTDRANAYFRLFAACLFSEMVASPLSGFLMTYSPWTPYLMSLAIQIISMLLIFVMPETLPPSTEAPDEPDTSSIQTVSKTMLGDLKRRIKAMHLAKESWSKSSLSDRAVLALLMTFFVTTLGKQSMFLLLQYASKRFHWSYARAAFLLTVRAVVNLLLLLFILPLATKYLLEQRQMSPTTKDLLLLRVSGVILSIGSLMVGFAWTPAFLILGLIVLALGSAFHLIARSLAAAMVTATERGVLFTAIAVISGAGQLIAGPFLAATFNGGLSIGGWATGLPFIVAGALFAVAASAAFVIRRAEVDSQRAQIASQLESENADDVEDR